MKRDELEQCLRGWKVRLRDSAHDVEEIQRRFYASKGAAAVRSLEKNGFAAHYAASRGEAAGGISPPWGPSTASPWARCPWAARGPTAPRTPP